MLATFGVLRLRAKDPGAFYVLDDPGGRHLSATTSWPGFGIELPSTITYTAPQKNRALLIGLIWKVDVANDEVSMVCAVPKYYKIAHSTPLNLYLDDTYVPVSI